MGPSGSGKSTLMNIIGCLDRPTKGTISIGGIETSSMSRSDLAYIRNKKIGFIFQSFNLLARSNALSNVMLPFIYSDFPKAKRRERALEVLDAVGLSDRWNHRPNELSGGQKQRVAIARALVNNPAIILADEPTGNIDSRSGLEIMTLLQKLNQEGMTILLVTHDRFIAEHAEMIINLFDGRLSRIEEVKERKDAWEELQKLPPEEEVSN
jgi:putative ABC transport system ATP-binding protein